MKDKIKSSLYRFFSETGSYRLLRPIYSGRGTILGLHRVVNAPSHWKLPINTDLETHLSLLDSLIEFFHRKSYDFVHLSEALSRINKKASRRFVVLTFDDGYKDIESLVYPLLRKKGVPFTCYLTGHFSSGKGVLWWYLLERLQNKNVQVAEASRRLSRQIFTSQGPMAIAQMCQLAKENGIDPFECSKTEILSWTDLRRLNKDSLIEFGALQGRDYRPKRPDGCQSGSRHRKYRAPDEPNSFLK